MPGLTSMPDFSGLPAMPNNRHALRRAERIWGKYEEKVRTTEQQIDEAWRERQQQLYGDPIDVEASAIVEVVSFLDSQPDD